MAVLSKAEMPFISARASSRAETGSESTLARAAASSWTSISIWSSVVMITALGLLGRGAKRFLPDGVALDLRFARQEPRDADGDDDEDHVCHQRSLQPYRVADGAVDRNADGPGHEAQPHDEPGCEAGTRPHQLLRHQQQQPRGGRGEKPPEHSPGDRPRAWAEPEDQHRRHPHHHRT